MVARIKMLSVTKWRKRANPFGIGFIFRSALTLLTFLAFLTMMISARFAARLVGDGGSCTVELGKVDSELLVECRRLVLKEANRGCLSQYHRHVAVAAPVDSGVDPMTKGDVVRELVQLAIYRDLIPVRTCIGQQREPIIYRQQGIRDHEITVEEKFQNSNASARDNTVARGVRRVNLWESPTVSIPGFLVTSQFDSHPVAAAD